MARQPLEDREYEVSAAQLRWRLAQLNAAGVPIQGYQQSQGNVYIITVQQPAAAPPLDWQAMQTRPRRNDDGLRRLAIALGAIMIVACIAWLGYTLLTGAGVRIPWQGAAGWSLPNPAQPIADAASALSEAVAMLVRVVLAVLALAGLWLMRGLLGPLVRGAARAVRGLVGRLRR